MLQQQIKKQNEKERKRRSMLIFGNDNMGLKIEQTENMKRFRQEKDISNQQSKKFIDYLFLESEGRFLSIWD